jgi:hypothetical protein
LSKIASCAASLVVVLSTAVDAHPRHRLSTLHEPTLYVSQIDNGKVVGGRPAGCPHAFCGCEASLYRFGRLIPELNLASNWRRFPRAAPAAGMAAIRSGHVMILQHQVDGNIWSVHDGNSGGHLTREHLSSLAGYMIVDPSSAAAMAQLAPQPAAAGRERRSVASRTSVAAWAPADPANPLSISTH